MKDKKIFVLRRFNGTLFENKIVDSKSINFILLA